MKFPELVLFCCMVFSFYSCRQDLPDELQSAYQTLPDQLSYNFDIRPILSDKCFNCHGPDAENRKGDLRLDEEAGSRQAIVTGKPWQSKLVDRILTSDREMVMPPPESHLNLTAKEKTALIKWIEQGAAYEPHWAFQPPQRPNLPEVQQKDWPKNPIDYFVLERLEREGLTPEQPASEATLLRRWSFSLTGLPPNLEEMERFEASADTDKAQEAVFERFFNSPAYGERMAMHWMDVARYADSDGYLDDKHREFWPWRDWVIRAFNENMPYDEFVSKQVAGDLFPDARKDDILPTAFNRLHRKNSEAGIVFEEYRTEYVADRTHTFGTAFLGLTMECARCHDHKYDPISQKDYYRMFGFFNSTHELGTAVYGPDQTPGPALLLSDAEQEEIIAFLEKNIQEEENRLLQLREEAKPEFTSWIKDDATVKAALGTAKVEGLVADYPFEQMQAKGDSRFETSDPTNRGQVAGIKEPDIGKGFRGQGIFLNDYTQIRLPEKVGWFERTHPFSVSLAVYPDTVYQEAGLFYHCEDLRLGLKGYSAHLDHNRFRFIIAHSWPQNALQVTTVDPLPVKEWTQITVTYDGSSRAKGIKLYLNGKEVPVEIDFDHLYKGILFEWNIHTYGFAGFTLGVRDKMKTFLKGGLDELKIYQRKLSPLEVLALWEEEAAMAVIDQPDSKENELLLRQFYIGNINPEVHRQKEKLRLQRELLNQHVDSIAEIMVMGDLPKPRPTYVLNRGSYDAPTEQVEPGVPEWLLAFDPALPTNRLGLAKWLFDKQNPLTARVFVNRLWQMHFGTGLVKTANDFGSQGDLPSHPELLDWLAVEFMESGWDIQHIHRLILGSATYQQSSGIDPAKLKVDPENRLLARGPRFRLPAEMIRDNALEISGLLVDKVGGPSVYPYQPEGLWDEITNKHWRYKYLQQPGDGLYRRSLYTIWKRTSAPPSLLIFDTPDRSVCTVTRTRSSTPQQALVLLNDPQYLEAARVLAFRLLEAHHRQPDKALEQAFRLSIGRRPDPKEIEILKRFYQEELTRFEQEPEAVNAYFQNGEWKPPTEFATASLAALATVVNSILNTTDAYTLQ